MQIEVIDDASTDADVEAIVAEIGAGCVKYFRQPENVGSLRNFETCINRSRGQLIHLLHGDDRVRPGFYEKISELFENYPEAGAAFCRFGYIDEAGHYKYTQPAEASQEGILENWLLKIGERNRIQYASIVVRRGVYEQIGSFCGVTYGEDWEMWARIAHQFPVAYTPQTLADYRKHMSSISGNKSLYGEYLDDLADVMQSIQQYLPIDKKEAVLRESKKFYSHHGVRLANELWHISHDKQAIGKLFRKLTAMHKDPALYFKILKLRIKLLIQ